MKKNKIIQSFLVVFMLVFSILNNNIAQALTDKSKANDCNKNNTVNNFSAFRDIMQSPGSNPITVCIANDITMQHNLSSGDHREVLIQSVNNKQYTLYAAANQRHLFANGQTTIKNLILTTKFNNSGGVQSGSNADIILENVIIKNNSSSQGGGVFLNDGSKLTMNNSIIDGNTANQEGGGIYAMSATFVKLNNSKIINNEAGQYGGGILINGTDREIRYDLVISDDKTIFEGNFAGAGLMVPPVNASQKYPNIKWTSLSYQDNVINHAINNYDIDRRGDVHIPGPQIPTNPTPITPEQPVVIPENPDTNTPEVPIIVPGNPDTNTPEVPIIVPGNPDTNMPGVDIILPGSPDTNTPVVPPALPENPTPITPGKPTPLPEYPDPIGPTLPVVVPENPSTEMPGIDIVLPETPDTITPVVPPALPEYPNPIGPTLPVLPIPPSIDRPNVDELEVGTDNTRPQVTLPDGPAIGGGDNNNGDSNVSNIPNAGLSYLYVSIVSCIILCIGLVFRRQRD